MRQGGLEAGKQLVEGEEGRRRGGDSASGNLRPVTTKAPMPPLDASLSSFKSSLDALAGVVHTLKCSNLIPSQEHVPGL